MFDNGRQNVVFYPKLASSSDQLTQVHHQGESCRSCWMQIMMINAEKHWWSMQRNRRCIWEHAVGVDKIGKSSLSIWIGVSPPLLLHCTSQALGSHLQMSFPPSWIGINFHRSSHPGIFLVKNPFSFHVNHSELYTLWRRNNFGFGYDVLLNMLIECQFKLEQSFFSYLR